MLNAIGHLRHSCGHRAAAARQPPQERRRRGRHVAERPAQRPAIGRGEQPGAKDRDPRLALDLYPDAFAGLRDVALATRARGVRDLAQRLAHQARVDHVPVP